MELLKQQFRRFPLKVGKRYRHDGKDRPNQKMACPWRGNEVVVIKHLKSGLYQVRVTKGRFSSDSDLIYTLPKNEFEPIEDEPYDYPEHLA